jgi:hypothetical protein
MTWDDEIKNLLEVSPEIGDLKLVRELAEWGLERLMEKGYEVSVDGYEINSYHVEAKKVEVL